MLTVVNSKTQTKQYNASNTSARLSNELTPLVETVTALHRSLLTLNSSPSGAYLLT